MIRQFSICVVLAATAGCGGSQTPTEEPAVEAPTPQLSDEDLAAKTLLQMLELARAGDFEAYVDDFYGETHKLRSPADRDALVRRFKEKWGDALVEGLDRASKLPVVIDGDQATFLDGDEPAFILHRSAEGSWKFHL